ncbi:MAG: TIGR03084 family metal-binding protein [bacterium]
MTDSDARSSLKSVVEDLRAEGDELYQLIKEMDTGFWTQVSTFKDWTVWDVVAHLHLSDHMALTSLRSSDDFKTLMRDMGKSGSMRAYTNAWLTDNGHSINGPELLIRWREMFLQLCAALAAADPDERFAWAGPGMKARMFATARQMETWAHGWEIYDLMNLERQHTDRLQNIVTIGVRTFGWSFSNRKLPVPESAPYLALTAPSGKLWTFNEADENNCIHGSAVDFCQVVTQVRNVADTQLQVRGDIASAWMAIAQCFAGPPEDPPAPGTRSTSP